MTIRPTFMEDVVQSIILWGARFIDEVEIREIATGHHAPPLDHDERIHYHVWDAWADNVDYPDNNLFGHSAFAMDTDGFTAAINFSYGLSFVQDKNLNRHTKIMSRLFARLGPGEQIPLINGEGLRETPQFNRDGTIKLDPTTGNPVYSTGSWLVVADETQVLPVVRSNLRPVQFLQVTLLANPFLLGNTWEDYEKQKAQVED